MTGDRRFMTYTRLEKAYRRMLARRMPAQQKHRKLLTQYQEIAEAVGVSVRMGKGQSDSLIPVRPMTVEGHAQARLVRHHLSTLERIMA
jgi:hypothetical protein